MIARVMNQTKPRKTPTIKQKMFAQAIIRNKGNATKSAMEVYDVKSRRNAKIIGVTNMQKEVVKEEIQEIMKQQGMTPGYILQKMDQSLNQSIGVKAKNADAVKLLDMMLKLSDAYPKKQSIHKSMSIKYNLSQEDATIAQSKLSQLHDTTASLLAELKDS